MAQSVTLSSAGTATMALNPVAKSTTLMLTATSGSSASVIQVEVSLDDTSILGGPSATWALASSAAAMGSSTITSGSGGLVYTILAPIAGARLNSSALTASSAVFTLKALQAVTA